MKRCAALGTVLLAVLAAGAGAARADDTSPELQLAEKYAPVVALKQQTEACSDGGEPYRPVPADVVLGRSDVDLVDSEGRVLRAAPTAADLFHRPEGTYLDFPGSPLDPGCSYEQWADQITKGKPTTAYAHVLQQRGKPGKLVLQYWLYYVFNDWNNKHESDWEMIQLMFDASSASDALKRAPTEVGYSQHEGAESAEWDSSKLQKQGLRPIVFPGRGSHANYYKQSIWLGHSAQEGFGCDNTTAPVEHGADAGRADARRAARIRGRSLRVAHLRRTLGPGGERSEHRPDRPEHQGAMDRAGHLVRGRVALRAVPRCRSSRRSGRARPPSSAAPSPGDRASTSVSCGRPGSCSVRCSGSRCSASG